MPQKKKRTHRTPLKRCLRCREWRDRATSYRKDNHYADGYRPTCMTCTAKYKQRTREIPYEVKFRAAERWRKRQEGMSFGAIAAEEGVSKQAIMLSIRHHLRRTNGTGKLAVERPGEVGVTVGQERYEMWIRGMSLDEIAVAQQCDSESVRQSIKKHRQKIERVRKPEVPNMAPDHLRLHPTTPLPAPSPAIEVAPPARAADVPRVRSRVMIEREQPEEIVYPNRDRMTVIPRRR
jgi:predicted DNA-binding protein YlxM (UPF0122 family)